MKIVVLDGETANPGDNPWSEIERLGEFIVYPNTKSDQLIERASDAEILLTNKVVINSQHLSQLPKLKFIAVLATGYNIVDLAAATRQNVLVSNVPIYSTQSVAQTVFAGLLTLLHRPELHHQAIIDGQWQRSGSFSFWLSPMTELSGKTFGIVGLGRIGRAVARLADALGMKIAASSRTQTNPLDYTDFQWLDIDTLFSRADVISLHCPQTNENAGFVNQKLLSCCKSTALLVNTARGGLVNEHDLANALNSGTVAGAYLDVVSTEPIAADNPLLDAKNCLLTPHFAWATIEARRRLLKTTAENIAAFVAGKPINLVRPASD